eukprot:1156421-Pelagomonas_calceolata.AAC.1
MDGHSSLPMADHRTSGRLGLLAPSNMLLSCCPGTPPRKGEGPVAVPAYLGSLAEVKTVPVTKPVRAEEQKQNIWNLRPG